MEPKTHALIAIAAALTTGCEPCLRQHITAARQAGATPDDIRAALTIAREVRLNAVLGQDAIADTLARTHELPVLARGPASSAAACGPDCDCH